MKHLFAEFFNTHADNIFLFAKGRVGLYAVLEALNLKKGDEIIMPGYTCMVVPSAARFLNIQCKYADIDPETYNINPSELDRNLTGATKALIVQHTYGIPMDMNHVLKWANKNNIPVIEDSCHAFGSRYKNRLCGTFGIASFFSGQWNKPFFTGLGGMLLINDEKTLPDLHKIYQLTQDVSLLENIQLKAQIIAFNTVVTPRTNAMITNLYRFLSRIGIAAGSSSNEELEGKMPSGYFKKMAPCQIKEGEKNLRHIQRSIDARKKNTKIYSIELKKIGFKPLRETPDFDSIILRYPLRVANKKEVLRLAARYRLEIGSWFEVTLHPEGTDMTALGYHEGMCPNAEKASREVINLPTHAKITPREISLIIEFLQNYAKPAY